MVLNETGQVILDGSGNGTVRMRPDGPHEQWLPTLAGYVIARTRDPYIFAVWAGGDPGAQATIIVNGTKTIQ